jgi:membrane associated rhomboid family serine protease
MIPLRDVIPSRHFPKMTVSLILINVLVFFYELSLEAAYGPDSLEALAFLLGLVPARYTDPDWARMVGLSPYHYGGFISYMFLHGGWLHLIGNMWSLWLFGDNVEDRMGSWRFLIFYLLCGALAGVTQFLITSHSHLPLVGASGAIAGVMGAYLILYPRSEIVVLFPLLIIPIFFRVPAVVFLGIWFLSQLYSGTSTQILSEQMGGVAFWAHVGGFIIGIVLYRFFLRKSEATDDFYSTLER